MKKINIGEVNMTSHNDGTIKGFQLKRKLTLREARYIMDRLLMFNIFSRDDFETAEEYKEYNDQLLHDVTVWLNGDAEEYAIKGYAYDMSSDEVQLGFQLLLPVIAYLKKKQIID